jgi:hypothetical protein
VPTAEPNTSAGKAIYARLRANLASLPVGVGGSTAQDINFYNAVHGNFPLMLGLIALVTFVLRALNWWMPERLERVLRMAPSSGVSVKDVRLSRRAEAESQES